MSNPLSSWADRPVRSAILDFVERVTKPGSDFLPDKLRVAVFDNDGTLWSEKPLYVQGMFLIDRVRALAPGHPEWAGRQPFKAVLEGDPQALSGSGPQQLAELVNATHTGMSVQAFDRIARDWLATARHGALDQPHTALIYHPMLELMEFLRGHGFRLYIVSGGGVDFIRACAEELYGIPPEHVIGSAGRTELRLSDGRPDIVKLPEIELIDDGPAKPLAIERVIGRRPVLAVGNSDGDYEMLHWTTSGEGPRLGLLLHHTDAEREWAYDRDSRVGRLDRALKAAPAMGWRVIDMKRDWTRVHVSN